jgi:hypothetical protein
MFSCGEYLCRIKYLAPTLLTVGDVTEATQEVVFFFFTKMLKDLLQNLIIKLQHFT